MSHTFAFICRECTPQQKFVIEREEADTNKLGNVFCPGCGKKWGTGVKIELNLSHLDTVVSKPSAQRGKENIEQSRQAQDSAMRDREYLDRTDPEIRPGIRQSQVNTINERMGEVINNL